MAYDVNKLATIGQLKVLGERAIAAINQAVADLPKEQFLDQAQTQFINNFTFSAQNYPGVTDPNLNGKPVFVLAVKGVDNSSPSDTSKQSISYSFLDMSTLVDTYTVKAGNSAKVLSIAGREVEFKISETAGNILTANSDGLYATNRLASSTQGHIVTSDANGAPQDGGILASTILIDGDVATSAEVTEMLNEVFGASA